MKTSLLLIALFFLIQAAEAQKYISRDGHIWFFSHTPLEDIEAHNQQVAGILDISAGSLQFSLLVKSFEFKRALMQEHFNENYVESDKFPKADFTGKITRPDKASLTKDGTYPAEVTGDLTLHGVARNLTVTGTFTVKGGKITAVSGFVLKPEDYDIEIPAVVRDKIASEIEVNVDITFSQN